MCFCLSLIIALFLFVCCFFFVSFVINSVEFVCRALKIFDVTDLSNRPVHVVEYWQIIEGKSGMVSVIKKNR